MRVNGYAEAQEFSGKKTRHTAQPPHSIARPNRMNPARRQQPSGRALAKPLHRKYA
jgi:hypothetical protein